MLLSLPVLLLNLSTSALHQSQHQIRAELSWAHVFTHLPSSTPAQSTLSNEKPRFGSLYPYGSLSSQWDGEVSQSQLPAWCRGCGTAAEAVRDKRWVAGIAVSISITISHIVCTQIKHKRWQGVVNCLHHHQRGMFLFVSSHRAGLTRRIFSVSRDWFHKERYTDICFVWLAFFCAGITCWLCSVICKNSYSSTLGHLNFSRKTISVFKPSDMVCSHTVSTSVKWAHPNTLRWAEVSQCKNSVSVQLISSNLTSNTYYFLFVLRREILFWTKIAEASLCLEQP